MEDQLVELETLRTIFYDGELEIIDQGPPANIRIIVKLDSGIELPVEENDTDPQFYLNIIYTPDYPNTKPEIYLIDSEGLDQEEESQILSKIEQCAEEYLGMSMVFNLVSTAKDEMERLVRDRRESAQLKREKKLKELEEIEQQRFAGSKTTLESFMEWRTGFLKEMAAIKAAQITEAQKKLEKEKRARLTGRQLFERDGNLAKSDMTVMDEGDVAVDLSLFESEMDVLDLDDDDVGIIFSDEE